MNLRKLIKDAKVLVRNIRNRKLAIKASMVKDFVFAGIKMIFGIFVPSYFFCVSGLYSVCIGLAKNSFFEGERNSDGDKDEEYKYFLMMARFILVGSIVYVIYMARLFFISADFNYGMIPSITIAAVSFSELVFAIIALKKADGILAVGLRCTNLTSAFTAIVLTQVAIMSFSHSEDSSFYNAITGTVFGSFCIIIGVIMIAKYITYRKHKDLRQQTEGEYHEPSRIIETKSQRRTKE